MCLVICTQRNEFWFHMNLKNLSDFITVTFNNPLKNAAPCCAKDDYSPWDCSHSVESVSTLRKCSWSIKALAIHIIQFIITLHKRLMMYFCPAGWAGGQHRSLKLIPLVYLLKIAVTSTPLKLCSLTKTNLDWWQRASSLSAFINKTAFIVIIVIFILCRCTEPAVLFVPVWLSH